MVLNLIWIIIASLAGFGISAICAGWLKLPRNVYLLCYIPLAGVLFALFVITTGIHIGKLISHHWYWGLLGAAVASFIVIRNVLSQPSSERSRGPALVLDILWPGFAYGLVDSLLLSVLPILAVSEAFADPLLSGGWPGKIAFGAIALVASLIVTAAYHLGYPEFRNKRVLWTMFGNGVLSLAYILTMNPLAAILPHIGMHITAMIHGKESTGQVPPHYHETK
jgi:hypothetical protein